jgi:DNA helicase II / ATP-dependent DNA helicase PcrA
MHVTKIFGPPGSGKTTYLLSLVEKELESGTRSTNIGYFSFTRKASTEARDRAIKKFPTLNAQTDFPYFRTLHSLAYQVVGIGRDDLMQSHHYHRFAKDAGISLNITVNEDGVSKADSTILNEINLARLRGTDLREHYNKSGMDIEWFHLEYVERSYRKFKEEHSLVDFTDLLNIAVLNPSTLPSLEVLIIDEAQDLSRLQWDMVQALARKAQRVYIAGDDDQAIFGWAGSDVDSFLSFDGTVVVLEQSYRVPQVVHELADSIISKIKHRQGKEWKARDFAGEILQYQSFEYAPVVEGEWLIMAATSYMLEPVQEWLEELGLLYEKQGRLSFQKNILEAVYAWEHLRAGKAVRGSQVTHVYRYFGDSCVAKGHKTFKHGDPNATYTMSDLKNSFGLLVDGPWMETMDKIGLHRQVYLSAMLRRGVRFGASPSIQVSTIHGAKGGEADNVLLLTDLSPKFMQEYVQDDSDMRRLLYVGLTRAKKSLHIVLPKNTERGFPL